MRMKLSKSSQLVLVTAASLAVASLITACQQITQSLTVDFVYVASALAAGSSQYGEIDVFEINSESGKMRQIPTSPFPSEGRNPVAEAVSTDYQNLFVVNHDDNSIVQFVIGIDGKVYPYNTVNTPGIYPMSIAVSKSAVFVLDTYQPLPLCSPVDPCSGSIAVYPLSAATQNAPVGMQNPAMNPAVSGQYWPLTVPAAPKDVIVPTGVNVLASGAYVYVTGYDSTTSSPAGYVFAFSVGSNGVLTAVPGSPFAAGAQPSAVSSDSKNSYVYVADSKNGNVLGFSVGSNGTLTALSGSPYPAGNGPSAIIVNPTYPYVYVTNALDATVTAFSIGNSGVLTQIGDYATGLQPVAIGIDPSTNRYLFTANFLGNTVSNFELSTTAATLLDAQASPYSSNTNPTAAVAIPHDGSGGGIQP